MRFVGSGARATAAPNTRGAWNMKPEPSRGELSPINFLKRNAETMGERTAVVHGGRRYTWGELQARSNRLASALWNRGIERNDRVAVLCPNTPALLEAHN